MEKYGLTREKFEESLLLLEYHFVCCLRYVQVDGMWQGMVTPFSEWNDYLNFEARKALSPSQSSGIKRIYENELGFIYDLNHILEACQEKLTLQDLKQLQSFSPQQQKALSKLIQLEFIKQNPKGLLTVTSMGAEWLSQPLNAQVVDLSIHPLNDLSRQEEFQDLMTVRNIRLLEKSLKGLPINTWISVEQFLKNMTISLGDKKEVTLKNRGRKWKYEVPLYSEKEKLFVETLLVERLHELGIVEIGFFQDKAYFYLTSFGQHFIH
jgi:hypothetical protein